MFVCATATCNLLSYAETSGIKYQTTISQNILREIILVNHGHFSITNDQS